MASLAEREGLKGGVQCIYFDPPYGIKFNSNFQWSTTSRDVKDGSLDHITREPEQVKAFRDTWRDGIHSYLTYLRDRLTIARELLADSGSIFVQIGDENVHRVRALMDEVFGEENLITTISFKKTGSLTDKKLSSICDYIIWYAKNKDKCKFRSLLTVRDISDESSAFRYFWDFSGYVVTDNQAKQLGINLENRLRAQSVTLTSQHESKTRLGKC
jgi:adenine-specific DNA-methyltransferase